MADDLAMDPQNAVEAGLPEEWQGHVRDLRAENARRRKENQDLRAQLVALEARAREAETAQAAASDRSQRDAARLAGVHRRLKEAEFARLTRQALAGAVEGRRAGRWPGVAPSNSFEGGPGSREEEDTLKRTLEGGTHAGADAGHRGPAHSRVVDVAKAQRLLERVPAPVDLDADLTVDDEGRVVLESAAGERLRAFVDEMADLASVEERVTPPPVGGEPPRPAEPGRGRLPNAWDPAAQRSPAGKAQAALRQAVAKEGAVLDGLARA